MEILLVHVLVIAVRAMTVSEIVKKETRRDLKTDNEGNKDAFKWLAIIWRY